MNRILNKVKHANRRAIKVRSRVVGTSERPRMSVSVSNKNISVQIIDDGKHQTIASVTTVGSKIEGTMTEKAEIIGTEVAKKAKAKKIKKVSFDRGSKLYHGRVKALADAARKEGLEF
ncbi:50S ribosomal protein L18 [Candidatus Saccharibacteria bacterium RIFCSPHIGHO2_12_FULL_41_12]|nr:MAG: 50S ribosomal protein L18 [Candidatus Saccharibacteria bacterium RIFCSPHIGHO2_12_FULL_41_12]